MHTRISHRLNGGVAFLLMFILSAVLLVGCVPVEQRQARAEGYWASVSATVLTSWRDAAQQIRAVVDLGRVLLGNVQSGVEEVKRRADAVQEGVDKIAEGKKLLEEGLGKETSSAAAE
ncbi:TPA: hypothetical protein DCL30_04220 [Candidatus Peribacteria bacterium]|nr:hypothetical protein [Candidatus Peribacteria bacterium]